MCEVEHLYELRFVANGQLVPCDWKGLHSEDLVDCALPSEIDYRNSVLAGLQSKVIWVEKGTSCANH